MSWCRAWALAEGDRLLLCSDGLWGPLKEPALLHGMHQGEMLAAIPALVQGALAAAVKGSDNVTALGLLCQAASAALPAAPPPPPPAGPSDTEPATLPGPDLVFD